MITFALTQTLLPTLFTAILVVTMGLTTANESVRFDYFFSDILFCLVKSMFDLFIIQDQIIKLRSEFFRSKILDLVSSIDTDGVRYANLLPDQLGQVTRIAGIQNYNSRLVFSFCGFRFVLKNPSKDILQILEHELMKKAYLTARTLEF